MMEDFNDYDWRVNLGDDSSVDSITFTPVNTSKSITITCKAVSNEDITRLNKECYFCGYTEALKTLQDYSVCGICSNKYK